MVGDKDLPIGQLAIAAKVPGPLNYGNLRLQPFWDPLRGDPRFEKIVNPWHQSKHPTWFVKEKTKKIKQKAMKRTKVLSVWDRAESLFP